MFIQHEVRGQRSQVRVATVKLIMMTESQTADRSVCRGRGLDQDHQRHRLNDRRREKQTTQGVLQFN